MHQPEKYEVNKSSARKDLEEAVPQFLSKMSPLKQNSLLLDYGCGAGSTGNKFFLPLAQASDSQIHAVDISPSMVEYAGKHYGHPRVEYFVGNLLSKEFPLAGNQYDRIYSVFVLHYVQDYEAAMSKFFDLMKPGGEFGFLILARSFIFSMYRIVGEHPKFKEYMIGYEEFIPKWYQQQETIEHAKHCFDNLVHSLGLELVYSKVHYQRNPVQVDTAVELYISLNPFVTKIPGSLMDDLRNLYREISTKFCGVPKESESYVLEHELLSYVVRKPEAGN